MQCCECVSVVVGSKTNSVLDQKKRGVRESEMLYHTFSSTSISAKKIINKYLGSCLFLIENLINSS